MTNQTGRRAGDDRPFEHDDRISLRLRPAHDEPFRFLPKHGQPSCIGEWLSQRVTRLLTYLPVYIALVVTLSLFVQVFGIGWP